MSPLKLYFVDSNWEVRIYYYNTELTPGLMSVNIGIRLDFSLL